MLNISALALVGQLVDHYDRWQQNPNSLSGYKGMTIYDLSGITKVYPSTAYRNMQFLLSDDLCEYEEVTYRNTTKKLYRPTLKAVHFWHNFKQTETGKDVYAFIAARWLDWYKRKLQEKFAKLKMKPPFRI